MLLHWYPLSVLVHLSLQQACTAPVEAYEETQILQEKRTFDGQKVDSFGKHRIQAHYTTAKSTNQSYIFSRAFFFFFFFAPAQPFTFQNVKRCGHICFLAKYHDLNHFSKNLCDPRLPHTDFAKDLKKKGIKMCLFKRDFSLKPCPSIMQDQIFI